MEFTPTGLKEQAARIVAIRLKAKEDEYDVVAEVVAEAEKRGIPATGTINGMRELADAIEEIEILQSDSDELAESITQPEDDDATSGESE